MTEKTINFIISVLGATRTSDKSPEYILACDEAIECLEAKEKYDRMAPIYNDKESFESALEKAWKFYNKSGSRTVDSCEDNYIECVFSKGFREGFLYKEKQKEQKQWNEEDERMLSRCIKSVECSKQFADSESYKAAKDVEINWLKSLPERFVLQAKQEWSEEDEDFINMLILHFNYLVNKGGDSVETYKSYINGLKSLRYKPHTVSIKNANKFAELEYKRGVKDGIQSEKKRHWKPSEHQMNILKAVKEYVGRGSGYWGETLGSLIEDLEKL